MSILTQEWINDISEKSDAKLSCVAKRRAGTIPGNVVGTVKTGKSYAEAFEVCEYGAPLTDELKSKLFPF